MTVKTEEKSKQSKGEKRASTDIEGATPANEKRSPAPRKGKAAKAAATRKASQPSKANAAAKTARKPGRPRKAAEAAEAVKPSRSPGRPRKAAETAEDVKPSRKPGRPRKAEVSDAAKPARKPGRPRKAEGATAALKPVRSPGRPRKIEDAAMPKRRPGRPRKAEVLDGAGSAKRGPGRPRKATESVTAAEALSLTEVQGAAGAAPDTTVWMTDVGRHGLAFLRALLGTSPGAALLTADEVLTPKEVGDLVGVREKEIMAVIETGELKATRIGNKWRTTRHNVTLWLNG